jgi:dephospho-CoA kinase
LTDRRNNIEQLRIDSPISVATPVLTMSNIDQAVKIIGEVIKHDDNVANRKTLRDFYFDNVQAGESTSRFFNALRQAIAQHSSDMQRAQALAAAGTGPKLSKPTGANE